MYSIIGQPPIAAPERLVSGKKNHKIKNIPQERIRMNKY